jgi:hypothetical protein
MPARVYWMRRLVVLTALAVVVAVVVLLVRLFGGAAGSVHAGAAATARPRPTTSTAPSTTPSPTSSAPRACAAGSLKLTLTADAASYPRGALPTFTVTIVDAGPTACLVDAGDAQREIVIASGADRIWSSRDCASPAAQSRRLLLAPGAPDATQVQWPRTRSAAGCPGGQPAALKGTYSAVLTLAGASSQPVALVLQ